MRLPPIKIVSSGESLTIIPLVAANKCCSFIGRACSNHARATLPLSAQTLEVEVAFAFSF
jgi:hypothetical protein